ncbi:hypothetical protein KAR91_43440 [Candidatus Pacearchaeota archaeon]|nr:hypothetical protein [Candidatus Pacearchaeota archaeon]
MSSEFIQFGFPCNDCLVAAACKDRKNITNKDLLDKNRGVRCLALPVYNVETNSHQKSLLECTANLIWDVAAQLNEDRKMKIPSQYRHFLIEYLAIFQYIINSTSWREGLKEVAPFDTDEIKRKLNTAKTMLKWVD